MSQKTSIENSSPRHTLLHERGHVRVARKKASCSGSAARKMFREPKPSRAFTSTGKRASPGTSSGAQLRGDGMPFSTKK